MKMKADINNTKKQVSIKKVTQFDNRQLDQHLHGATLIDKDGTEIPITEEMIQEACLKLLKQG